MRMTSDECANALRQQKQTQGHLERLAASNLDEASRKQCRDRERRAVADRPASDLTKCQQIVVEFA